MNKDNNNAKKAGQELVFSKAHNVHERHLFHKKVNLFDEITIDDALAGEPGDEWDQVPDGNGGEYLSPRESFLYYRASRDVMSLEKTKQIVRMTRYDFETGWALLKQVEDHICYQNVEEKEEYLRYARLLFRALNGVQARFSLLYNYFVKKKDVRSAQTFLKPLTAVRNNFARLAFPRTQRNNHTTKTYYT